MADPDRPVLLDHLARAELALPGDDPGQNFWENEDLEIDPRRKLVFLARERSAFGRWDRTGVYLVSAADPRNLRVITFAPIGTGHTTTCINDCSHLWTAGRDRMTHDVQVDARGIAWVSGTGGTRGYHTSGLHRDPLTGGWRRATATRPVPYAGGAVPPADAPTTFTHNSLRPVGRTVADGPRPSRQHPPGSLLLHSEERFGTCQQDAKVVISSLRGSYDGESWRATPAKPFYLRTVSTWSPYGAEGYDPRAVCSAHYFSLSNRLLASAWFEQGTRILDLRDPARPVQIAFWRPPGTMAFEATWHRGRIYVADHALGVQILAVGPGRQGR